MNGNAIDVLDNRYDKRFRAAYSFGRRTFSYTYRRIHIERTADIEAKYVDEKVSETYDGTRSGSDFIAENRTLPAGGERLLSVGRDTRVMRRTVS